MRIIAAGTKTVAAAATPEALKATYTRCRLVWVGARINQATGAAVNTKPALVGITGAGCQVFTVDITDFKGYFIPCEDANQLYIDVGVNGEGVQYAILGD